MRRVSDLTAAEWSLLHTLRLCGLLAASADGTHARVIERELVRSRSGRLALTDAGRELHARWARLDEDAPGYDKVVRFYGGFAALNRELLVVCSAWQVLPSGATNDHRDAAYDWGVTTRLVTLHERAAPAVRGIARHVERFAMHDRRLRFALRQVVDEGDAQWFTSPRVESYHTVWNQLHEDLLLALGRDRADEPA